ncbi:MAG: Rieske 2Fe-2S domain-containing protein [Alphaproteobacteria bacterium]
MSKALNYLAAARPEAATHLLGFYKHSVRALDDKTRHLVQIVTKVVVGTERGLRQYAPKALKAGASREEILDAVMMAFPAAGLNRVLDAVDILRSMDLLPVVDPVPAPAGEVFLGPLTDFPIGRMHCLQRGDSEYVIFRVGPEEVRVYDGRCPHSKAKLSKGIDHGDKLECKVHNWTFDLATGRCLEKDKHQDLVALPVALRDGGVYLTA